MNSQELLLKYFKKNVIIYDVSGNKHIGIMTDFDSHWVEITKEGLPDYNGLVPLIKCVINIDKIVSISEK